MPPPPKNDMADPAAMKAVVEGVKNEFHSFEQAVRLGTRGQREAGRGAEVFARDLGRAGQELTRGFRDLLRDAEHLFRHARQLPKVPAGQRLAPPSWAASRAAMPPGAAPRPWQQEASRSGNPLPVAKPVDAAAQAMRNAVAAALRERPDVYGSVPTLAKRASEDSKLVARYKETVADHERRRREGAPPWHSEESRRIAQMGAVRAVRADAPLLERARASDAAGDAGKNRWFSPEGSAVRQQVAREQEARRLAGLAARDAWLSGKGPNPFEAPGSSSARAPRPWRERARGAVPRAFGAVGSLGTKVFGKLGSAVSGAVSSLAGLGGAATVALPALGALTAGVQLAATAAVAWGSVLGGIVQAASPNLWRTLTGSFELLAAKVGLSATPLVIEFIAKVQELADGWDSLDDSTKSLIASFLFLEPIIKGFADAIRQPGKAVGDLLSGPKAGEGALDFALGKAKSFAQLGESFLNPVGSVARNVGNRVGQAGARAARGEKQQDGAPTGKRFLLDLNTQQARMSSVDSVWENMAMGFLQENDFQRELNNIAQKILDQMVKQGSGAPEKPGAPGFGPGSGRG